GALGVLAQVLFVTTFHLELTLWRGVPGIAVAVLIAVIFVARGMVAGRLWLGIGAATVFLGQACVYGFADQPKRSFHHALTSAGPITFFVVGWLIGLFSVRAENLGGESWQTRPK